jgi:hypothetical protein
MYTAPASEPFVLSDARSIAPRWPFGVVKKPASPAMTRVLVTSVPILPVRPCAESAHLSADGSERCQVSPVRDCHTIAPLFMSIAVIRVRWLDERETLHGQTAARHRPIRSSSAARRSGFRDARTKSMSDRFGLDARVPAL